MRNEPRSGRTRARLVRIAGVVICAATLSAAGEPPQLALEIADYVALPITGFAQAEYRRQFELLANGKQFLMLFPAPPQ